MFLKRIYYYSLFLFLSFVVNTNILMAWGNFEIIFENSNEQHEYQLIQDLLNKSEKYFFNRTGLQFRENFQIFVSSSLNDFLTKGYSLWVGGVYHNKTTTIQPIKVLKRKSVLEKTLFIEYSHFFIDQISAEKTPHWLNEMLSLYFYAQYANIFPAMGKKNPKLHLFKDFTNLTKILKDFSFSNAFIHNSLLFAFYLEKKSGENFWLDVLKNLKKGKTLNSIFIKKFNKTPQIIYENELDEINP